MRRSMLLGACLLLSVSSLAAAPVPTAPANTPAPRNLDDITKNVTNSVDFARQLYHTLGLVSEQYVRPVPRDALIGAALRGLYEAARVPVPASLEANLRRAKDEQQLFELITNVRADLGDVEALRGSEAMRVSCTALTRVLDPHSVVVTGEDLRRGSGVDSHTGVGLVLADNLGVGRVHIKTVIPGSPAQVAGLRPGDEISHVDGKPVRSLDSGAVRLMLDLGDPGDVQQVRGLAKAGEQVETTVARPGSKGVRKVVLERKSFRPETILGVRRRDDNSWDYMLDRKNRIAHIRIGAVGNGTALEFRNLLTALESDGVRGVLLDLRWCPGGYLRESVNVASLLLGECTVATIKSRSEKETPYTSIKDNKFLDVPVLVLVNAETSGGAELIAAALQDNKRAKVAGQRTVGKGSVQTMIAIPVPESGLKLTTGTFQRPNGKNLHRFPDSTARDDWGVRPDADLELRTSPELARQLKEWWLLQTLRPHSSNEALPLDDPTADPQRQAALKELLKMAK